MDREDLLRARGWRQNEAAPNLWRPPAPHGEVWMQVGDARSAQIVLDRSTVDVMGSVIYRPTAEQAQTSALCLQLGARAVIERDVIEHLFRENARLVVEVQSLAEMMRPPPVVLGTAEALTKAQAIADAWRRLAQSRTRAVAAEKEGRFVDVSLARGAATQARRDLRDHGIDPDAEPDTSTQDCPTCRGLGRIRETADDGVRRNQDTWRKCLDCRGAGTITDPGHSPTDLK